MVDGLAGAVGASVDAVLAAGAAPGASGHGHGPASLRCLNCGHWLAAQDRFCSACGQDTANHPPTLAEFVHEFADHYVAAEGKLWKSLWGLLAKPGFLTQEYIAGRKSRYVLPLRLLLTLGLVFFLALKLVPGAADAVLDGGRHKPVPATAQSPASGPVTLWGDADDADDKVAVVSDPAARAAGVRQVAAAAGPGSAASGNRIDVSGSWRDVLPAPIAQRVQRVLDEFRKDRDGAWHRFRAAMLGFAPYAVLCSLPFFAALLKLLFWRQTYGAHFVFAMHLHAAWYGMLLVAVLLPWPAVQFAVWLWSNVYPVLALKRVHAAGWVTTALRAALLAVLHWVLISLALMSLMVAGVLAMG